MAAMRARVLVAMAMAMVALLVAGCTGGDDDEPATTTTSAVVTTVPVVTTGGGSTTTPTTAPSVVAVVLRADGLGVVDFGDTKDATLAALSAAFGPVDETGTGSSWLAPTSPPPGGTSCGCSSWGRRSTPTTSVPPMAWRPSSDSRRMRESVWVPPWPSWRPPTGCS